MKKPEAKKDLKQAIAACLKTNDKEIRRAIMEEVNLKDFFGWQARLFDDRGVLIADYYEDLQDYEDDAREVYEEVAKATKVYLLFSDQVLINIYLNKEDLEHDAKWEAQEAKLEGEIDGRVHEVGAVESTLCECNPSLRCRDLLERIEVWGQRNHVKELFQKSLEDGKLCSYVSLNFKASKLDRPVMSWSDKEWKEEMAKFTLFVQFLHECRLNRDLLHSKEDLYDTNFLEPSSRMWGKLENDLAAKILKDYEEGNL